VAIADFETLLKEAIGLDAATIGRSALDRAIRERERACRLADQAYCERVSSDGDELQALVEAVVVPETWFFRDREAFTALGKVVRDTILRRNPNQEARILSLPCSTGEEPYSMAMALIDAGVSPKGVRIDAVDVSHRALGYARRGVYGKSAFRRRHRLSRSVFRRNRFRHADS
jgi:chemotaxis protein methyltransferase WspC